MLNKLKNPSKGQSLLEIIIIIAVTGVTLVAVTLAATISIRNARVSSERTAARNYAFEVFESIRAVRKADPETFFNSGSRIENLSSVGTNPVYNRKVTYTQIIAGEKMFVRVEISWEDAGTTFSVIEETTYERYIES